MGHCARCLVKRRLKPAFAHGSGAGQRNCATGVQRLGRILPSQEQQDHQGPHPHSRGRSEARQGVQNLSLRSRQRRQPALRHLHHRPRQMRADGPRRADQDQERDRPDPDLPPLVPRGDLRVLLDEHGRAQRPRLHHRDRGFEGRGENHALAAHGRGQGSGPRLHPFLRPICLDPAVAEDQRPRRLRARNGSSRPTTAPSWTASTSASCAPAARPAAPAIGGTPTASLGPRSCSRPIASSSTAATRRPASGSTSSRTRSSSTAATRS